ncbi:hypothetical protein L1887_40409 [Cichorium endivia]|nr:hypothetical protein L1887_40409 [Cichorium endivia]
MFPSRMWIWKAARRLGNIGTMTEVRKLCSCEEETTGEEKDNSVISVAHLQSSEDSQSRQRTLNNRRWLLKLQIHGRTKRARARRSGC